MSPTGSHWLNFVYVNIGFLMVGVIMAYVISVKAIKDNWGKYRCNPMFMMFSDDISGDFQKCIAKTQEASLGTMMTGYVDQLNEVNNAISENAAQLQSTQSNLSDFQVGMDADFGGVSSMFENGAIEMKKVSYGLSDIMGKVSGVAATLLYVLDGNMKTMSSMWKGPPGQVMRSLGKIGHCFHPSTPLELKNGEIVSMESISPGMILKDGSRVVATMKVDNKEPLMVMDGGIYVTGSHLIQYKNNRYIRVSDHPDARRQTNVKSDWYACLVTDTHKIQIGNYTFWDWEDYYYH
jgi:hypothetical protein